MDAEKITELPLEVDLPLTLEMLRVPRNAFVLSSLHNFLTRTLKTTIFDSSEMKQVLEILRSYNLDFATSNLLYAGVPFDSKLNAILFGQNQPAMEANMLGQQYSSPRYINPRYIKPNTTVHKKIGTSSGKGVSVVNESFSNVLLSSMPQSLYGEIIQEHLQTEQNPLELRVVIDPSRNIVPYASLRFGGDGFFSYVKNGGQLVSIDLQKLPAMIFNEINRLDALHAEKSLRAAFGYNAEQIVRSYKDNQYLPSYGLRSFDFLLLGKKPDDLVPTGYDNNSALPFLPVALEVHTGINIPQNLRGELVCNYLKKIPVDRPIVIMPDSNIIFNFLPFANTDFLSQYRFIAQDLQTEEFQEISDPKEYVVTARGQMMYQV